MRKPVLFALAGVVVAALVIGYLSWAILKLGGFGDLRGIWIFVVLGVGGTGVLTAIFMWLAFFSSRRGFDEPTRFEDAVSAPDPAPPPPGTPGPRTGT